MMKLREETIEGKKGRGEFSDARRPVMQKELEILRELLTRINQTSQLASKLSMREI